MELNTLIQDRTTANIESNTVRIAVVRNAVMRNAVVGGGIAGGSAGVHLQNLQNVGGVEILTM